MVWLTLLLGVALATSSSAGHVKTNTGHVERNRSYSAIYKRKHNVDGRTALGAATEVVAANPTTHGKSDVTKNRYSVDAFNVYYPPGHKGEHLLLGHLSNGLSDPAVEVLPGALAHVLKALYGYLAEGLAAWRTSLNAFFDNVDKNLAESSSIPMLDLGDVLF